jgi:hypothetical protein
MAHKVTVAYYSIRKGVTQQQTGAAIVYYGRVFKIPRNRFSEDDEIDFEKDIGELIEEIQQKGLEPVLDQATVERYETWDIDEGDLSVMYRVPCKNKEK